MTLRIKTITSCSNSNKLTFWFWLLWGRNLIQRVNIWNKKTYSGIDVVTHSLVAI